MKYGTLKKMIKLSFAPPQGDTNSVPLSIGLSDTARSYGIRAGKGGQDERGLAYSQGTLSAAMGGVGGGGLAGAVTGSPFVTSTLLLKKKRDKAISQGIQDIITAKSELAKAGLLSVADTVLDRDVSVNLSPKMSNLLSRRLGAAAGAGAIGAGLAAAGRGLYNAAEYEAAKRLSSPENQGLKTASVEYRGKEFPGYNQPIDSDRPEKKKMVLAKRGDQVKLIHFGQKGYKHNYSDAAKKNYLTRSAGIRGKDGSLTANDKFSANYWARRELWPKNEPADGSARSREKRASGDDSGHIAALAGFGILAAPLAVHLAAKAKVPGVRAAAEPVSQFLNNNLLVEHAMEFGGLSVLAMHFRDKRKQSKRE